MSVDNPFVFVDIFEALVAGVRTKYDPTNNVYPKSLYGQYLAVANELMRQGKAQLSKYPLILLGFDREYSEREINSNAYEVSFNIWIIDGTKKEWYTSDRFEHVYRTVLLPLRELLIEEMIDSNLIGTIGVQDIQPITFTYPYWGNSVNEKTLSQRSEKQMFSDPTDAINIKFSSLKVFSNKCN